MSDLTIVHAGGADTFTPGRCVRVGRSSDCDVTVDDARVSRSPHLEVECTEGGWVLMDRSRGGTFIDGVRVGEVRLVGTQTFRLGSDPAGPTITTTVTAETATAPGTDPAFLATLSPTDRALHLDVEGRAHVFAFGSDITIGRAPDNDVRTGSLLVSRHHLRFGCEGSDWFAEDLGSQRGTWVDGRRRAGRFPVAGTFSIWLGGAGAGEEVKVVTAGEHRLPDRVATLTTVFTDLVGSTSLLTQMGDVAADTFLREHMTALIEVASRHEGEIVKSTGDGLMVVFHAAATALDAAAAMQRAVGDDLTAHGVSMRVGVATGDAARERGDWYGVPVVAAARLCAHASGGQILVAELAVLVAGSRGEHDLTPIGAVELKGIPTPVVAYDLRWQDT